MRSPEKTGVCPHCGKKQTTMLLSNPPQMRCCDELMWWDIEENRENANYNFSVKGGTPRGNR